MNRFPLDYRQRRPDPTRPSLKINTPGDAFEQQAERMAREAVPGSAPGPGASAGQREAGQEAPAQVHEVLSSSGQPLDPATRGQMEAKLGHDFSQVRVHADGKAAESARSINAQAYTSGPNIAFAAGRYDTASASGQRLLAHELTHVVQQTSAGAGATAGGLVQRNPAPGSAPSAGTDLRETASPMLASALGSTTVDNFGLGSAKIPTAGEDSLRYSASQILYFLNKYPGSTVHVAGHTDTVDTEAKNLTLGQERADAVSAFLQKERVPVEAISTESKGESDPVKPTDNGVAEPANRRVNVFFRVQKAGMSLGLPTLTPPTLNPTAPPADPGTPKVPNFTVPTDFDGPRPPFRPKLDTDLWDRMQENQRQIDRYKPPAKKGVGDLVVDKAMDDIVKPIIRKVVPEKWQKKAEEAARSGLKKGTEKACEAAIDALNIDAGAKEGLKTACKAALEQKPK